MLSQYVPDLSKTPTASDRRDAIHIAVAPVKAGEVLTPGQKVGIIGGKGTEDDPFVFGVCDKPIGVVSPFLDNLVRSGEIFWLLLFQNTVTTIRHLWEHPAFKMRLPESVRKLLS